MPDRPEGTPPHPDLMRDRVIVAVGELYDVDEEIGRGGMSIVYRATDLRLRRPVAIKVLPPDLAFRSDVRTRFLREAETAAQLSHPHIVPIYSVDERDGLVFFVMALVEGESVGQRLVRERRFPVPEARRILREVADALAFAHRRGVVHRDVKPDNILLERRDGRALVTDFGIARAVTDPADSRLTVTGMAMGTPAYMSPEQAMGERELDGRSDIYGLGVVAYQMLAGHPPFTASSTPAMLMKQIGEHPRPLREVRRDVPPALAEAIERALAKRPADRWPDAGTFRDALDGVGTEDWGLGTRGTPPGAELSAPRAVPQAPGPSPQSPPRRQDSLEVFAARPVDERIRLLRRNLVASGATTGVLFAINMVTFPFFPWFIFPAVGMGVRVVKQWGTLSADGVKAREVLGGRHHEPHPAPRAAAARASRSAAASRSPAVLEAEAGKLAPPEVLSGAHGGQVRRAVADRAAILDILASLSPEDRALIPDIAPTVDALVQRAASLAQVLHRLDTDVSPDMRAHLERRIAAVEREPDGAADRERRLALLRRQRSTLDDLAARRARVASQLESVAITLGNLRLDLVKLRSSGVASAMQDVTSATREARALSKEIGHVLDAAAELRRM